MPKGRVIRMPLSRSMLAAAQSDYVYNCLCGGYGSGKTELLLRMFFRRLAQNYRYRTKRSPSLFLAPTYDMAVRQIVPRLHDLLRRCKLDFQFSGSDRFLAVKFRGYTAYTRLVSAENFLRLMGAQAPDAQIDELDIMFRGNMAKQATMWERLESRTRILGATNSIDCACTPEGHGFVYHKWVLAPEENEELKRLYALFKCSTYENAKNLPPDYIKRLLLSYSHNENLIKAYLGGEFVNLNTGLVYYAFDPFRHIADTTTIHPGVPLEFSFDFNVSPMTCVVSQYLDGDYVVHDCIQDRSRKGTEEVCRILVREYGAHRAGVLIYGDATGGRASSSSGGRSDRDIIRAIIGGHWGDRYSTRWAGVNPWPPDRFAAVNAILAADRFVASRKAKGLIDDMKTQPLKPGTREADSLGGKVGHAGDAFGYRVFRDHPVARTLDDRLRGAA